MVFNEYTWKWKKSFTRFWSFTPHVVITSRISIKVNGVCSTQATGSDMFFNIKGKKFVHSEDITPDNFNELLDCITWDTSLAGSFDSYKPAYVVEVRNKFYREWDEEENSVSDVFMISHLSSTDQSWIKEYYPTFNERCERRGIKE